MNALIIFDSYFGNTEQVARAIREGAMEVMDADVQRSRDTKRETLADTELLIIGSPTRKFRTTEGVKNLIAGLGREDLAGIHVAAFDTRLELESIDSRLLRYLVNAGGYAAKHLHKALSRRGGEPIAEPEGFLVTGEEGPLKQGELQRARNWGKWLPPLPAQADFCRLLI